MTIKEWFVTAAVLFGMWGANQYLDDRYVQRNALLFSDINRLDGQITLIKMKEQSGEATGSELSYLVVLETQRKVIEKELGK